MEDEGHWKLQWEENSLQSSDTKSLRDTVGTYKSKRLAEYHWTEAVFLWSLDSGTVSVVSFKEMSMLDYEFCNGT